MYQENQKLISDIMPDIKNIAKEIFNTSPDNIPELNNTAPFFTDQSIKFIASCASDDKANPLADKISHLMIHDLLQDFNEKSIPFIYNSAITSLKEYIYKECHYVLFRSVITEHNEWLSENKNRSGDYFLDWYDKEKNVRVFFEKYIALDYIFNALQSGLTSFIKNIFSSFKKDNKRIKKLFGDGYEKIRTITPGLGDRHNGGHSTSMIFFGHDNNKKLLYKPTTGNSSLLYKEIVEEFYKRCNIKIYTPAILSCKNYHWCEFIESRSCESSDEIMFFYRSIGIQMMIVYLLNGGDFHYENIIAMAGHPVIVDMECLFSIQYEKNGGDLLINSVMSTGILPMVMGSKTSKYISAISAIDNEKNSKRQVIDKDDENNLYIRSEDISFKVLDNIPRLNGTYVTSEEYRDVITDGFTMAWEYAIKNKQNIINLITKWLPALQVRKLHQATSTYSRLLSTSYHPRFLKDMRSRNLVLSTIFGNYEKGEIAKKSHAALVNGDIPFHLITLKEEMNSDKDSNKKNLLSLYDKLSDINEDNLTFQKKIINLSLNTLNDPHHEDIDENCHLNKGSSGTDIAESLLNTILTSHHKGHYFNFRRENKQLKQMSSGIYNGTGGIIFICICFYMATHKKKYLDKSIELLYDNIRNDEADFGAFSGQASNAYLLDLLYGITADKKYFTDAVSQLVENFEQEQDKPFEFLNGHAGCLTLCVNLHKHRINDYRLLKVTNLHLNAILDGFSYYAEDKVFWDTGLTGISHGNAGVIYALSLYIKNFPDSENKETITSVLHKAINYENSFRTDAGWTDLREDIKEKRDAMQWCNGAPGILLSRVMAHGINGIDLHEDIDIAEKLLARYKGKESEIKLCHGYISNLIIKDYVFGDDEDKQIRDLLETIINSLNINSTHKKISSYNTDISLMTGLCGSLYAYLYTRYDVPFILNLSPWSKQSTVKIQDEASRHN